MSSRRSVLAALGLLPAGLLAACGSAGEDDSSLRTFAPNSRRVAPTLSGTTLDGTALSTAAWVGHPIVVNVWGSWCQPCRTEGPAMAIAARTLMAQGVHFLGLDTQESGGSAAALAYVQTYGIPYPSLVDTDGTLILALAGIVAAGRLVDIVHAATNGAA